MRRRINSPNLTAEGEAYWAAMLVDRDATGDVERARPRSTVIGLFVGRVTLIGVFRSRRWWGVVRRVCCRGRPVG